MKHSTLKVLGPNTVIDVVDIDALDFLVIIEGEINLVFESKAEKKLEA